MDAASYGRCLGSVTFHLLLCFNRYYCSSVFLTKHCLPYLFYTYLGSLIPGRSYLIVCIFMMTRRNVAQPQTLAPFVFSSLACIVTFPSLGVTQNESPLMFEQDCGYNDMGRMLPPCLTIIRGATAKWSCQLSVGIAHPAVPYATNQC